MKTLYILRHAKSIWSDPNLDDFERPLNARGERDAPLMGQAMADRGYRPEIILSSPAKRARRTDELDQNAAGLDTELVFDDRIYEASPQTLLAVLSGTADDKSSAMIVGHNPGMEGLIKLLTGTVEEMPTASLALIELTIDHWTDIGAGTGRLIDLLRPSEIGGRAGASS